MPGRWLSSLVLTAVVASVSVGCRAPYPTYNPYGMYGNPCVTPPGTYNPAAGRTDPYYGQPPATGVYPPNPYANPYPGYPPNQPPAGTTSQSNWRQTTSAEPPTKAEFVANAQLDRAASEVPESHWRSVNSPSDERPTLDVNSTYQDQDAGRSQATARIAAINPDRFDGFARN